jgi:hypothetical protein
MTEHDNKKISLGNISRFPDIDLSAISKAISLARSQVSDKSSYEDVVTQAIANLPGEISSFERGVISGIVLVQITLPPHSTGR